ncbi:hypothetical protein OSTOST_01996 [Ostertagia ostertagi]
MKKKLRCKAPALKKTFLCNSSTWRSCRYHQRRETACTFCGSVAHYSNSCPRITDGDERYRFVRNRDLCQYCLNDCNPCVVCSRKEDECFYCEIMSKKECLRFLIPNDGGHHRALCNVPDSRNRIAERIREVEREIEEIRCARIVAV